MESPDTRNWTRNRADECHIGDDVRITTGPGRYTLESPNGYCNATFAPEPTIRQQKWGASQVTNYGKTDVESDLFNLNRATTKSVCGLYDPNQNRMNSSDKRTIQESSFPQTHARLNDPPCTLRGTGWNRWEWLCQNPQNNVMMPFDWYVPGRILHKDAHRPCIPTPLSPVPTLPTPLHLGSDKVTVPGAYGTTLANASSLGQAETPAYVLPERSQMNYVAVGNNNAELLLDSRNIAWQDSPSIGSVQYPVPTGPPSVGWQRNDYAQSLYNTNSSYTTNTIGQELPGPGLKTSG